MGETVVHPGEVLRVEFMEFYRLSGYALANALGVSRPTINDLVREQRAVSPSIALRLARYFGTSAEFWMNLQSRYDLRKTRVALSHELAQIQPRGLGGRGGGRCG